MPTVRIHFHGVAVHLIGTVPGVPCRIVMPDATASYLYAQDDEIHVLDRHFTSLRWDDGEPPHQKEVFRDWFTVGNPVTPQDFQLDESMKYLYHLDNWVPNLQLSSEVVYAGRTALYFDVFYGKLSCHMAQPSQALFTTLQIETQPDQDPYLIRIPFHYASFDFDPTPPTPEPWPLPAEDISVVNIGDGCGAAKYDFALSFLVTRGGIPRGLKDLPGESQLPKATVDKFPPHSPNAIPLKVLDALSAACSASSFPKPGG